MALRRAEVRAHAPNHSYHERSMTTAMLDVARSLAGSGFPVGWVFMRVDRAHVTLDASLTYLLPDVGYLSLGQRYWEEARGRSFGSALRTKVLEGVRRARAVSGVERSRSASRSWATACARGHLLPPFHTPRSR
jgi:hypothetical protein